MSRKAVLYGDGGGEWDVEYTVFGDERINTKTVTVRESHDMENALLVQLSKMTGINAGYLSIYMAVRLGR